MLKIIDCFVCNLLFLFGLNYFKISFENCERKRKKNFFTVFKRFFFGKENKEDFTSKREKVFFFFIEIHFFKI